MAIKILMIDDQPANVAALEQELNQNIAGCNCEIVTFENAQARIQSLDPDVIVLDLLQGTGADAQPIGLQTRQYIWNTKFCPLVLYTAAPELVAETEYANHPFCSLIQKGAASEVSVRERIQEFGVHITALALVTGEVKKVTNTVLQELAPRIFNSFPTQPERADALTRSVRRRVAAKMDDALSDDALSIGGPNLRSWELYLCPPVVEHLLTGDIIRREDGAIDDPASYALVLTPSCDMATSPGRQPKVARALISKCTQVSRLLQDLSLITWNDRAREKVLSTLRQGYSQSCLPLPGLPGVFPSMAADFRCLELIPYPNIAPYIRIASVDNPLRELVAWAYLSSAARPGLPDRDFEAWATEIGATLTAAAVGT